MVGEPLVEVRATTFPKVGVVKAQVAEALRMAETARVQSFIFGM